MTDYLVPLLLFLSAALALRKKENAYDIMLTGAAEGLSLLRSILPGSYHGAVGKIPSAYHGNGPDGHHA